MNISLHNPLGRVLPHNLVKQLPGKHSLLQQVWVWRGSECDRVKSTGMSQNRCAPLARLHDSRLGRQISFGADKSVVDSLRREQKAMDLTTRSFCNMTEPDA